jgi:polyisoprenyl-phosphate glycosyltransferase
LTLLVQTSAAAGAVPAVSVVAPCFNEEAGLPEFHRRAAAACQQACGERHEIVLVDDGSRDGTWGAIRALAASDPRVVGVRLMRNQGHQAAASAGLALARGERVMLIDADLQDPPELLGPMMGAMDAEAADVVFGQRSARAGESWFKTASASLFYRLLSRLAAVPIPPDTGDFRLMRRRVVDALAAMPERQRFIRGMVSWVGGRQVALLYERQARHAGVSNYPLAKMARFALDAITGFSTVPLRFATWLGFGSAVVAIALFVVTLLRWATGHTVTGWSSTMTAIVFFGAVQLIVLGILGEYVGRLFQESKRRPLFLVDEVLAAGRSLALPPEFAALGPSARKDLWEATRGAATRVARLPPDGAVAAGPADGAVGAGAAAARTDPAQPRHDALGREAAVPPPLPPDDRVPGVAGPPRPATPGRSRGEG